MGLGLINARTNLEVCLILNRSKSLGLAGIALATTFAWAGAASAATPLTLAGPIPGNILGPQSASAPCVIAGTNCQNPAGFGFNNFTQSGAISSYNMYSTTPTANVADGVQGTPYTVSQITGIVGSSFNVAIDVNTSGAAGETLQLFEVINTTDNVVLYNYVGPTNIGNVLNNGNGFADWVLGTVSLTGQDATDGILFHAVWNNASAGAESFFLLSAGGGGPPTAVPEAETYAMLLAGLGLMGFIARRRKRSQVE
jgi:hypothetical protein